MILEQLKEFGISFFGSRDGSGDGFCFRKFYVIFYNRNDRPMKIEKFLYLKQQSFRPNNRTNRAHKRVL